MGVSACAPNVLLSFTKVILTLLCLVHTNNSMSCSAIPGVGPGPRPGPREEGRNATDLTRLPPHWALLPLVPLL